MFRATIAMLALALCLMSGRCLAQQDGQPFPGGREDQISLDVPYLPQEPLLCVPTSAAMILAFYGDPQPPRRLKAFASGADYSASAPFHDFTLTFYRDMVQGMKRLGYAWSEMSFPDDAQGFRTGMSTIETEIHLHHPVMVDVSWPTCHTFVVSGVDSEARTIFVVDPYGSAPGRMTLSFEQFEDVWNEHVYGGRFRSLIKAPPKAQTS